MVAFLLSCVFAGLIAGLFSGIGVLGICCLTTWLRGPVKSIFERFLCLVPACFLLFRRFRFACFKCSSSLSFCLPGGCALVDPDITKSLEVSSFVGLTLARIVLQVAGLQINVVVLVYCVTTFSDKIVTELHFPVERSLSIAKAFVVTRPGIFLAFGDSSLPLRVSCCPTLIVWIRFTGTLCKHHRLWLFVDLVGMGKECDAGKECGNPLHYLFSLSMFS